MELPTAARELLVSFANGNVTTKEFEEGLAGILFEMRQRPGMSSAQEFLSTIELYLHEIREGFRNRGDLDDLIEEAGGHGAAINYDISSGTESTSVSTSADSVSLAPVTA